LCCMVPVSLVTESIQDTRHVIHPWRNQKRVSDKQAPEFISRKSMLQSKI